MKKETAEALNKVLNLAAEAEGINASEAVMTVCHQDWCGEFDDDEDLDEPDDCPNCGEWNRCECFD